MRLTRFVILSMLQTRSCTAVTFLGKILQDLVNAPGLLHKNMFSVPHIQTRQNSVFVIPRVCTNLLYIFPLLYKMYSSFNTIAEASNVNVHFSKQIQCITDNII